MFDRATHIVPRRLPHADGHWQPVVQAIFIETWFAYPKLNRGAFAVNHQGNTAQYRR